MFSVTTGDITGNYFTTSTSYAYSHQFIDTTTDEYNNTIDYDYDPVTGLLELLTYQGPSGDDVLTDFEYDSYGRLLKVTKGSSSNNYVYEKDKLKEIEVNGFYYEFIYDDYNRIKEVWVNDQKLMSYDYYTESNDGVLYHQDKLYNQYYGNNDKITFVYDDEDRITDIKFNNNVRYHYAYDYAGRLSTYEDYVSGDTFTYKYDLNGRLELVTDQNNNTISLGYNQDGNLSDYDYTIDGDTNDVDYYYTYGDFKGMYDKTIFSVDGQTVTKNYQYHSDDSLKRLEKIALSIGTLTINQSFSYDDDQVVNGNASTRIDSLSYDIDGLKYTYTYDHLGNITYIEVIENSIVIEKYHYMYDELID